MTGPSVALAILGPLLAWISVVGAAPSRAPNPSAVVAERSTQSSTIQSLTRLDKLLKESPKDIVKMPPAVKLVKVQAGGQEPLKVGSLQAASVFAMDKNGGNGFNNAVDCGNAPDQSSAVILQILFGFFGGGFIYLDRMDLAYWCIAITFGPLLMACCVVFVQRGKKEAEGIEHNEPHRIVVAFWLMGGCCVAFLVCYFWSIAAIANGDITCGGSYEGCVPQA